MRITEEEQNIRRNRMLRTAYALFCEHGIDGVSLMELAKAAGVSQNSLYRYFDSKAELVQCTQTILWEDVTNRILADSTSALSTAKNGLEEVRIYTNQFSKLYENYGSYILFYCDYKLFLVRNHIQQSEQRFNETLEPIYRTFIEALERGREDGSISTAQTAQSQFLTLWGVIWGFMERIAIYTQMCDGSNHFRAEFQWVVDHALDALKNEGTVSQQARQSLHSFDALTGSRTCHKFEVDAKCVLERQRDIPHVLVKWDIDAFQCINQTYGYEKGDKILCCMAQALEKTAKGDGDIFARLADDAFIGLFGLVGSATMEKIHGEFLGNFKALMEGDFAGNCVFRNGFVLIMPEDIPQADVKALLEKAEIAHQTARLNKTSNCVAYTRNMTPKTLYHQKSEQQMIEALQNEEFVVYLQPQYHLDTEMIGGAEALTRWKNKSDSLLLPGAFLPTLEKNGLITKLDFYILRRVCEMIKGWIANGITPARVSVNFSRRHIGNDGFVKELCKIVDSVGIDRKYIEVELSETVIYENLDTLRGLVTGLQKNGFVTSMDAFGSRKSSLAMLEDLPVDVVKLDRSFFAHQTDVARAKTAVVSIIKRAADLGVRIVAEGVEKQKCVDFLRGLPCDMAQGFYYAKPMPAEEFTALITNPVKFQLAEG
ncbi:MAG: EAL domain-containing protein [Oscillospiraceae bacterium]